MASFRFLHAADIHLDSPLKGLSGQEGSAAERVRTAPREAFERLVGLAIEERVDFLVIAGDLYDGDWRDYNTGLFFVAQMGRLNEADIPVYLLHGNHDAASRITRRLPLPGNVNVFGSRKPDTFELEALGVALHGQSFREAAVTDNLAVGYPAPVSGAFNIGVLHTALDGSGAHENYAPCSLDDLVNKGYDYWALGHVHQARVLHERPHVVFPGNLQGRHVRETGAKGARLVTVEDGEVAGLKPVACDVVRWTVLSVSPGDARSVEDVTDRIRDALESAVADEGDGRMLACRIVVEGRTDIHNRLVGSDDRLLEEARAAALGLGDELAWVETVLVETRPAGEPAALPADLQKLLQEAPEDEVLRKQIEDDIGVLARRLPPEVRADLPDGALKCAVEGDWAALIGTAAPYLAARLAAREE